MTLYIARVRPQSSDILNNSSLIPIFFFPAGFSEYVIAKQRFLRNGPILFQQRLTEILHAYWDILIVEFRQITLFGYKLYLPLPHASPQACKSIQKRRSMIELSSGQEP